LYLMVPIASSQRLCTNHSKCRYIARYARSSATLLVQNNAMPDLVSDSEDDSDDSAAENYARQQYSFATNVKCGSHEVTEYQHRGHHHAHVVVSDIGTMAKATG